MATTAHAVPSLDVTASDAMDLHSDSGLDFGDADIELDLDPAPPAEGHDDDVSIIDAAADAALDTQTVPGDQDDYMVDNEDVIEEDDLHYGDEKNEGPALGIETAVKQEQDNAQPDEDLLDYSDEEEQQFMDDGVPVTQDHTEIGSNQYQDAVEDKDQFADDSAIADFPTHDDDETHDQQISYDHDGEHATGVTSLSHADVPEVHDEVDDHSDDNDGGVALQAQDVHEGDDDHDSDSETEDQQFASRPITVNYEGNELWLFKEHDTEASGDWLMENISVIHSSLSDFLKACRTALGEDISFETELGLRFNHLHNMEIYEDNTACVAVSLERLIGLYYTLHAQDGNNEPESFYLTLLSRPRFATLISDVAKYAEQGSGYSGLSSAVAAGDTHFIDTYSGHSTEHENTEWENEEGEDQHEQTESPSDSEHNADRETPREQNVVDNVGEDAAEQDADEDEDEDEHDEDAAYEAYTHASHSEEEHDGSAPQAHADANKAAAQTRQASSPDDEAISQSAEDARKEQEAQDTVDYSDDEGAEDQNASVNAPSPSTTVQGDELSTGDNGAPAVAAHEHDNNASPSTKPAYYHNHLSASGQLADDAPTESNPDYEQPQDEENTLQEFQGVGEDNQSYQPDLEGFTNEGYIDYDYQNLDQQLQDDFLGGPGPDLNGTGSDSLLNDFTGAEEYLDLNEPSEWTTGEVSVANMPNDGYLLHDNDDAAQEQEEEDGVVEHPKVAASPAAEPVAAPSADLDNISPQGLKRSIDEVGNMADDVPGPIDSKRPRV